MRYNFKRIVFLLTTLIAVAVFNISTVRGNPATPIEPDYDPDNVVPIDGGAGILIAAGVAYGLKKIHDKKKKVDRENLD